MNCHQCAGYGLAKNEAGKYETCPYCRGVGTAPRDPWTIPVAIFAAIVAAYFIWQVFIR